MKFSLLAHLLNKDKNDLVMIFCSTRRNVDIVANNLKKAGINSKAIHGGLSQNKRSRTLEEFHNAEVNILVFTDVAARGLDIKGVKSIYNYDLPNDAKDYIHRIGRTARAGSEGKAINILSNRDYENFDNIINDKYLNIVQEELPVFETIRLEIEPNRGFGNRNNSGRNGNRENNRREGNRNNSGRNGNRENNRREGNRNYGQNRGRSNRGRNYNHGSFGRGGRR